jgi:hypothetical protein
VPKEWLRLAKIESAQFMSMLGSLKALEGLVQ